DPKLFLNRELSWLSFNLRVLDETRDAALPLYERLKFLTIVSSNLDEFFMVRVAGLKQQLTGGGVETGPHGMLPALQLAAIEQLAGVDGRAHGMVAEQSRLWRGGLLPALAAVGVEILGADEMTSEQRAAARAHFATHVFPALTPLAVDPGHPFPHLRNKSLNIAVTLRKEGGRRRGGQREMSLAVVQVPGRLGRLVALPSAR